METRLKTGTREAYWMTKKLDKYHYIYSCSNCHKSSRFRKSPYCPMCGCRMVEGEQT